MNFREMSQDEIREMLEAKDEKGNQLHINLLAPHIERQNAVFSSATCPKCNQAKLEAFIDPARPFTQSSPLPHRLLRCIECRTEFDPGSGLILTTLPRVG